MKGPFYITTPIYYINDVPHIGHAYTTIAADVMARYKRLCGYEVFFLTGTDEHGLKIERAAASMNLHPKELADRMLERFLSLWELLGISNTGFIRTTEERHRRVVEYAFSRMYEKGDIYLGEYEGWYCPFCESYVTERDLLDGRCPDCLREPERVREESLFFRLSKYGPRLLDLLENRKDFILPDFRYNEVVSFVRAGLRDISVSRTGFTWGIPVPFKGSHLIYVWFDALFNYLTGVGFMEDEQMFKRFWPCNWHVIGKDILRFHAIFWPAFLMSLGLEPPQGIFAHGWWTVEGRKMSKSLGNVVDPFEVAKTYGVDEFRFFLMREVPFGLDGDFSKEAIFARINGDLANNLGNLLSRVVTMIQRFQRGRLMPPGPRSGEDERLEEEVTNCVRGYEREMERLSYYRALQYVFDLVSALNKYIDEEAPWRLFREGHRRLPTVLYNLWNGLRILTVLLFPFMPEKTKHMWRALGLQSPLESASFDEERSFHLIETSPIAKIGPLFPRRD